MSDTDAGQWLTIEKAAAALSRSSRTVRRMAGDGRLPSRKYGGRLLVDVSGFVTDLAEESDVATVKELMTEVGRQQDLIDRQESEIQFLRSALASALSLQQKAIAAPKRWRWPWQNKT